jgi:RNA polymerase II transcription elongation factor
MNSIQPEAGVSYPITLGSSFVKGSDEASDYSTLRLDFIPASCDRTSLGNLHLDPDNKAVRRSLSKTKL